jgi:hypothetical protein
MLIPPLQVSQIQPPKDGQRLEIGQCSQCCKPSWVFLTDTVWSVIITTPTTITAVSTACVPIFVVILTVIVDVIDFRKDRLEAVL